MFWNGLPVSWIAVILRYAHVFLNTIRIIQKAVKLQSYYKVLERFIKGLYVLLNYVSERCMSKDWQDSQIVHGKIL